LNAIMSREKLAHVSEGRRPWRRWVQLRRPVQQGAAEPVPVLALRVAAKNAEPPAWFSDWQRDEAKLRLLQLCEWLDDRLERPFRVERAGRCGRRIRVFDSLAYSIYPDDRFVIAGTIYLGGYEPSKDVFEVGQPLISPLWLKSVLRNLHLADADQGDLFFRAEENHDLSCWLADAAYRLLLRNPDFCDFRRRTLPGLFKFPQDIYGIALAARSVPAGPLLNSRTLNNVWGNERAFRQVARENPQLLPLLLAFVEQIPAGTKVHASDPVLALKNALREAGLSEASWRYLIRHGARLFRVPWEVGATSGQRRFEVAVRYLGAIETAGLPPPPPPSVARAFLHGYNEHRGYDAIIANRFECRMDPAVLRAGLLEADRRRLEGSLEGFAEEFMGVCWWAESLDCLLDDNQIKAGWKWFVRQWQEAESVDALLRQDMGLRWRARLDEFETGRVRVVPIDSSAALIRESQAMRNCLRNYLEACASGDMEIYSVRDALTGKRRGCVGLRFDDGMPTIIDAKGFANTPPKGEVCHAANELFVRLQRQACS
jgi:hypothetical protein